MFAIFFRLSVVCLLMSVNGVCAAEPASRPRVCLNMIVKNEKDVICRCLESVKPLIDYWVIVDTGSTDGTQEIIRKCMKGTPGELHEKPWVNFAHNRNQALELARPKAEYLLIIDADDMLVYDQKFRFPETLTADGYVLQIQYNGTCYDRIQLIRSTFPWHWEGVVHEVLVADSVANTPRLPGLVMKIVGGGDRSHDPKKYYKDAMLLEEALSKDPNNTRYTFYLAQSYRDAEMPEKALAVYERRVALGGWDQEVFWSMYQIGRLKERLRHSDEEVCQAYQKAFLFRPSRLEPLCQLATYYRKKGDYLMGYALAQMGMQIKTSDDVIFVETWMHQYGVKLEASICAYYLGRYTEALDLSNRLLADTTVPEHVISCVRGNLQFILNKLDHSIVGKSL